MFELRDGSCYLKALVAVNVALACVDGAIAVLAFYQLIRIHSRNSHLGWTRQKVFHLMIGSSNLGYFAYFVLTPVAACRGWPCWSNSCGFIIMACPKILFLAAFLLLLSFWVDLCHQANDEDDDDEEGSPREALLERASNKQKSNTDSHRRCCSFRTFHVGSRQKVVILVVLLVFVLMIASAVLIWIGMGKNPVDSSVVARVYVDLFAIAIILVGGALACYDNFIIGLAIVSVLCFTTSAFIALFTDIPMLYHWHRLHLSGVYTSLLLILYYFIGSSVPSAFVLWMMRELPPLVAVNVQGESRTIAFITGSSVTLHPQRWTAATSSQNQVSRASPI